MPFINIEVEKGSQMQCYVSQPQGDTTKPAIIVCQEAFGVNHYIRDIADRFAAEGYLAIAPELYHRTAEPGFEVSYTDMQGAMTHMKAVTIEGLEKDLQAVYDWLQQNESVNKFAIACIGFCLGGRVSYVANTFLPLAAGISFYGGGIQDLTDRANNLQSPHLFFWGGKDQHIKPEHIKTTIDAVSATGKDFINVSISYADHGFFCNERSAYNPNAAAEAWALTKAFLKNKFANTSTGQLEVLK